MRAIEAEPLLSLHASSGHDHVVTSLVILQPSAFCNINCRYCYLPDRNNRTILPVDRMVDLISRVARFPTVGPNTVFVWHAGEPLVLGLKYYESVFARLAAMRPAAEPLRHSIQTNATLITKAWCELFRRWDVEVGVSLDGTKEMNDTHRLSRQGTSTYEKAMRGILTLQTENIPFHVITVLTRAALSKPDALFAFYKRHNLRRIAFNIAEKEGVNNEVCFDEGVTRQEMVTFLARFFDMMRVHDYPIDVREFEKALDCIRSSADGAGPVNEQTVPFGIITIDVEGRVYTFSPELAGNTHTDYKTFAIGNIFEDSFEDLKRSPNLLRMTDEIARGVSMCRGSCEYFSVCQGGAPGNKIYENGAFASSETTYCRLTTKAVFDFVLDVVGGRYPIDEPYF